jgi:2-methylisocitrate lyase-like PEP mutase family enzyme
MKTNMNKKIYGQFLKSRIENNKILPIIGVYDIFSASLVSEKFEAVFCSGYGFSASFYGLPDEGFIDWKDMILYVERLRTILNDTHIIVDIDDGYGDDAIASRVTKRLEEVGASAVILEDQRRPKKCGHLEGKEILDISEYKERLLAVIEAKKDLYVIARTDSSNFDDAIKRVSEYAQLGADAILVEGLINHDQIPIIRESIPSNVAIVVNLIAGGKTDPISLTELHNRGVDIVNYSTPCLFAAQKAINDSLDKLIKNDGMLTLEKGDVTLSENNAFLKKLTNKT